MNQENIKNPINNSIERNSLTLELGKNLLSLIDTYYQAPLLEQINQLRKELSLEIGLIIPGIKITDNLNLLPSQYILKIRETPAASGEIFLERYLIIDKLEELGEFQGWSAQDPIYKMPAKWIESKDLKKAEDKGCTIYGPLIILIGHLKEYFRRYSFNSSHCGGRLS
ncbi:MAG: FHIPEP family type III secretion protein [Armatimonadetes bacterium]|nr:FHIPEP family type III secretion protein [Armatimonadota bacterium]